MPDPREEFETTILAEDKVDSFTATLTEKDRQILQMRMDGCTLEQIATFFEYKTPSACRFTIDDIDKTSLQKLKKFNQTVSHFCEAVFLYLKTKKR